MPWTLHDSSEYARELAKTEPKASALSVPTDSKAAFKIF